MTRKTTELYQAVFQRLHELAPDFQPRQVIADFEEAPTAAVRAVFGSDVVISGCWFHYAQALVKRLRKEGLADAYKNEPDIQTEGLLPVLALPLFLPFGPSFASPAFSSPAIWSSIFHSRIFQPCIFDGPPFSGPAFSVAPSHLHACNCESG